MSKGYKEKRNKSNDESNNVSSELSKKEIYDLINEFKSQGKAVIMISSEMPEILGLSDRILVLSQGRVTGEFDIKDASQEAILKCAVETKEAI